MWFFCYQKIIETIFPRTCIGCSVEWHYLCATCKKTLQPHQEICPVSHRFSQNFAVHLDHRSEVSYAGIAIGFSYNDLLKKLILQLKYYHRYDVSSFLVERLALVIQTNQELQRAFRKRRVIITSIPAHRFRKYCIKWYNQSELLASGIAKKLWFTYAPLLKKTKHTRIQAFLSRHQRMKNLEWVFSLLQSHSLLWDELILIVDDVTTTGSTINAAAKALKQIYPKLLIRWAVLGRHS